MLTRSRFPRHRTALHPRNASESVMPYIAALIALGYLASFLVWPMGERQVQLSANSVDATVKVEPAPQSIPAK